RFTAVNQQWLDTFGYSRGEVIGKWFGDFLSPINREVFNQNFPIFKAQGYKHAEFEVLHKNGNPLFIAFEGKIGYDLDGKFKQTHCILKDITKQKAAENSLRLSEEKYRKITENISDIIWTTDMNLKTTYVSPSIEYVLGESVQDHLKQSLEEKITPDCLIRVHELFSEELEKEKNNKSDKNRTRVIELEHYHADGSIVWLAMNISFLRDEFGNVIGLQGVSRDITELKHARDNLRYISEHDDLTGLYNRRYFEKEIKRLDVENQLPLSIIVVDINGLKLINDSFGRTEGDKTIKQTANILSSSLREGDVLARTGGDEFCILLSKTNIQTAREHLRTIEIACEQYNLKTPNKSFHINLSFGAATKETATVTFQHTYKEAEDYMRQRKLLVGKSSRSAVISSIKATMLEKSFETQEHEDRLSALTKKIGSIMNLSQIEINSLELLSKLHDIGKVAIAERILKKPGKLNEDEWIEMRKHPEIGYRIAMSSSETAPIAEYILCHHERWDGSGYPRKLRGTEIPLLSRILAIADAYDAMTENRVYNETRTPEEAFEEIKKCAGTQFDPEIAEIFVQMMKTKE
ncbi:MAG: diguanylate cyclase, partial [Synergistaceae bacterium]|nr:diguanylate cyclase [Synergistaceae bacterium]